MDIQVKGIVVSSKRQWWLKINKKAVRRGSFDGAVFPYIVKVKYEVDGVEHTRKKWVVLDEQPYDGKEVKVLYQQNKPKKIKVVIDDLLKGL